MVSSRDADSDFLVDEIQTLTQGVTTHYEPGVEQQVASQVATILNRALLSPAMWKNSQHRAPATPQDKKRAAAADARKQGGRRMRLTPDRLAKHVEANPTTGPVGMSSSSSSSSSSSDSSVGKTTTVVFTTDLFDVEVLENPCGLVAQSTGSFEFTPSRKPNAVSGVFCGCSRLCGFQPCFAADGSFVLCHLPMQDTRKCMTKLAMWRLHMFWTWLEARVKYCCLRGELVLCEFDDGRHLEPLPNLSRSMIKFQLLGQHSQIPLKHSYLQTEEIIDEVSDQTVIAHDCRKPILERPANRLKKRRNDFLGGK
eukprot:648826-Amphidinium_carterae.1